MLNFSFSELIKSDTANEYYIDNMPDKNSLDNILNLIFYCLQPIRNLIKKPIIITSGYRCKSLNKLIGGVDDSHHLIGAAADFIVKAMNPKDVIDIITKSNIEFNQLINEKNKWVHISYLKNNNKKEVLYIK